MDKTEAVNALEALAYCHKTKCSECKYFRRHPGTLPGMNKVCWLPDDDEILEAAVELLKGPEQNSNYIEVIRCKDCVHFSADEIPEAGCGFCELHSGTRYETDFCSSAGKQVKLDD